MAPAGSPPPAPSAKAEQLLLEHLARVDRGEPSDLAALCRAHPDCAADLRELAARFELAARLRHHARGERPAAADAAAPPAPRGSGTLGRLIERLASRGRAPDHYRREGEVARGAQGTVLRVFDSDLQRHVAMKVLHGETAGPSGAAGPTPHTPGSTRSLGRFLDEAQVTAQLDHPGIVPVHELGLDDEGRLFFTMKLVRGRSLQDVLDARPAEPEWSTTRVLGALLRVAEAMSFAHDRGVIHRDLKPSNVMLGDYGEVYVMDWGLARVLDGGEAEEQAAAPRDGAREAARDAGVRSRRREAAAQDAGTSLLTLEGDIVGTPQYMSPEQASGKLASVGPASDVYALGAMLYHVLSGRPPYGRDRTRRSGTARDARGEGALAVLERVRAGAPTPLARLAKVAPELEAICDTAMAREPADRYATMADFAADLRAYLESRVVRAYETGPLAELRKWVARNRAVTLASAGTLLALIGGLLYASYVDKVGRDKAEAETRRADRNLADLRRLSDLERLSGLRAQADALWPAFPAQVPGLQAWLGEARELLGRSDLHRATLEELRARALPHTDADRQRDLDTFAEAADLAAKQTGILALDALIEEGKTTKPVSAKRLERITRGRDGMAEEVAQLEERRLRRRTWRFTSPEDAWWHTQLAALMDGLKLFGDETVPAVERRLQEAQDVTRLSIDEHRAEWDAACASIADPSVCPRYGGLRLLPQLGLVPLGRDAASGLWEFRDLHLGEPPERGPDGKLVIGMETGLVFVLLPGGTFAFGAQSTDPEGVNYEPGADARNTTVRTVRLDPFFLSKYELTQGQWQRATGETPSTFRPIGIVAGHELDERHPVENVKRIDAEAVLARYGFILPTDAQWEYACRAGTTTRFWTGREPESLEGAANLADACLVRNSSAQWLYEAWLDDGHAVHAPVGSFRANAFGLHDMIGNVQEWTREPYAEIPLEPQPGEGLQAGGQTSMGCARGGGYQANAARASCAHRDRLAPDQQSDGTGLRAARRIER